MSNRQIKIRWALLRTLSLLPEGIMHTDEMLKIEAARLVIPRPTDAELREQTGAADAALQITGIVGDDGLKWKLADAGRAWLAEHP